MDKIYSRQRRKLAKRMKAKGLQKLKWYCQLCEKQCRDENGFKCHCNGRSHKDQMELFGENPEKFIETFSQAFEDAFLESMRFSYKYTRVSANVVYNEFIKDRDHVHMNATKWATLSEFVTYLGKAGKCKVEEDGKKWFLTYNNAKEEENLAWMAGKRDREWKAEEERKEKELKRQAKRAREANSRREVVDENVVEGAFESGFGWEGKVEPTVLGSSLKVAAIRRRRVVGGGGESCLQSIFGDDDDDQGNEKMVVKEDNSGCGWRAVSDELMQEPYWLCEGIVVKVISRESKEKGYYKQRGVVKKVLRRDVGEIEMLDTNDVLRIHQDDLETVIPLIGGLVRIVKGPFHGVNAKLMALYIENFCAKLQLVNCVHQGQVLPKVPYDDFCKLIA